MERLDKDSMKLYLVTDSTGLTEALFLEKIERALKGGVTMVQIREKDKSTREYMELGQKVHEVTKKYGVPLMVDDRIDVAMAIGAEGVHLGQSDMPVDIARMIVGDKMIIGRGAPEPEPEVAVPEPSTWALIILGVTGLLYVRKQQ